MMLEAVWLKNGKEVYNVSPVMNIVCYDNMKGIADIEVEDSDYRWHEYSDVIGGADDFVIRIKRD
jgi:hypothetical protein